MALPAAPSFSVVWQCPTSAIHQDATQSFFLIEWLDYNTSAQFRAASEAVLDLIQKSPAPMKFLLNDTEKLKIIGLSDQVWVRENFLPRLFGQAGLRRVAMVNSIHYFTRVGVQEIMRDRSGDQAQAGPVTEYFATRDEALRWLAAAQR